MSRIGARFRPWRVVKVVRHPLTRIYEVPRTEHHVLLPNGTVHILEGFGTRERAVEAARACWAEAVFWSAQYREPAGTRAYFAA